MEVKDIDGAGLTSVGIYLRDWSTNPAIRGTHPPFNVDQSTGAVTCTMDLERLVIPGTPSSVDYLLTMKADDGQYEWRDILTVTINNLRQPPTFVNLPATVNLPEDIPPSSAI